MNKNMVYVAVLAVLCVLSGVVVGAGVAKKAGLPWPCPERPNFSERAESFMRQGPGERPFMKHVRKGPGERGGGGLLEILASEIDLTKDQQVKVKEVLEKTRQEIDEVGKDVRNAITEIKEKGDKQIMDILNPEQQQKFKTLLDDFKKRHNPDMRERRRGPMKEDHPCPGEGFPPPQDE